MKKKVLSTLLVVGAVGLLLTGCGKGKEEKKAANAATREKIGFSGLEDEAVKNGEKAIRQSKREKDAKQVQTKKAEVKKAEVKKAEIKKPEIKPAAKGMI